MAELFYDKDADLSIIQSKKVAIIGYGSQGHAHAQNLRDSGVDVKVVDKEGSTNWARATADGFEPAEIGAAVAWADVIMILVPDPLQRILFASSIEPNLTPGKMMMFAHGFNIRFGYIKPPAGVDVAMVAPKGPGHLVRREYVAGRGVPVLVAVEQDASGQAWETALSYAKGIGGLRAAGIKTTFTEETESDLFGEQAVLCGGATQLVQYGFEVLHELKLIVDLMIEGGISKMRWSISDTAEYGDYVSGPRIIDPGVKKRMEETLADIKSGAFAKRFIADQDAGGPEFKALRAKGEGHPIESVGRDLRKLFLWNKVEDAGYEEGKAGQA